MRRFLIDTNVIVDAPTRSGVVRLVGRGPGAMCRRGASRHHPIIYAELAVGFERIEALEAAVPEPDWQRLPLPWAAGFLAGRCFTAYRRRGGQRTSPLPDFYIGGHAVAEGLTLVTRDSARFVTYFPGLDLVTPGPL